MTVWRNWAGDQRSFPTRQAHPTTVAEIAALVGAAAATGSRRATTTVKAVGAGHSFTDIAATDGIMLHLDGLSGLLAVRPELLQATFAGGTRLFAMAPLLAPYGLALQNMGDIDRQSLAGAISTGTHGTGLAFGSLATQVVALTLVVGTGEVVNCSATERPELFSAARVGLGALGIIVSVTLQCVPAFALHAVERTEPLAAVLAGLAERQRHTDHFEFFWFPHTSVALTKSRQRYPLGAGPGGVGPRGVAARWVDEVLLSNLAFSALCSVTARLPRTIPGANAAAARFSGQRSFVDASHKVFASPRTVRFREMEYAVPLDAVPAVLAALRGMIERRGLRISFPIEVRCAAADDIPLSTAMGRDTGYIALHQFIAAPSWEYFRAAEEIFLAHAGRPHWGKWHFLHSKDLRELYPAFDLFGRVHEGADPKRVFFNAYLSRVLG